MIRMKVVAVNDLMQAGYSYLLAEPEGKGFHPDFRPELTPPELLEMGIFGGKYMTDCGGEFPAGCTSTPNSAMNSMTRP
jgi:hypothetical protein